MRYFIFILFFCTEGFSQQTININGAGTSVSINGIGAQATINLGIFAPQDYEGVINNSFANLTESEPTLLYYGWGITYPMRQERSVVIRQGSVHGFTSGTQMVRFTTADGANTWAKDTIYSESGVDVRNYGGGTTSEGIILIFYSKYNGTTHTSYCMRSTNGGASFNHSAALQPGTPTMTSYSPHGPLIELENGTLIQSFYGRDAAATRYNYTLSSDDKGITWGSYKNISDNFPVNVFEPALVYLGSGKIIAAVRHDTSGSFDMEIYNSSDYGATYNYVGKCLYGFSEVDLPGTSPLLLKKSADTATIVSTNRSSQNGFIEVSLAFGDSIASVVRRVFYEGQGYPADNIHFGYPSALIFNSNDTAKLISFYDMSTRYVSGAEKTDVLVNPIFRREVSVTKKESGTITSGGLYVPSVYVVDEIPVINAPNNFRHKIRTATGSYSIRVEATFTGTGISRDLILRRYDAAGVFIENMFTESGSVNSYDFTTNQTMQQDQSIALQIVHDASPLTVTLIRMTITKL